ncbi:glycosyltransferase [Leeuwenhoekiella palythoae]|uniref:Cellulose synthase/poly-beta-1,6-N-acetylglucosamine synthase-like glycosyltransferase n=1 Tax=Leeuwenhoekiella palythoae TaxID=573501 RepID=A0A1M5Y9X0_9FLAO|nr:glycosyltransferase [Leeuwenhoekiella palythoae]RXG30585.1 cellulose synthase/poly-beta-1,6-N-acetylglucosamine synthase-like glycosyltransferase [Leeuwenhoekiella palythoae]SHI08756.1 Glycosyltransferase, catalytic subunit of cellulose synthase and poly-beta-1,6-N-acetylglucosamine synthase [Leeuwenhoekiella palythoae]
MTLRYFKLLILISLLIGIIILMLFSVVYLYIFAILNFVFIALLAFIKTRNKRSNSSLEQKKVVEDDLFISIHIPIYKEPVSTVLKTIQAAINQNYSNFEVLVIYNNTPDINYWKPVQNFCEQFSEQVKFLNFLNVKDYKAGALNKALPYIQPQTDLILTVDADYELSRNALKFVNSDFIHNKHNLIQYPQHYNNLDTDCPVNAEFNHYFEFYSKFAANESLSLPTGTLSAIDKKSLEKLGGWPTVSITEDAQLGIQLFENNFSAIYIDRVIGAGTAPNAPAEFIKQRERWIYGNFQNLIYLLKSKKLPLAIKAKLIPQLTCWFNFNFFSYLILLTSAISISFNLVTAASVLYIVPITIVSLLTSHLSKFYSFLQSTATFYLAVKAFLLHQGLAFQSSIYWLTYFIDTRLPFRRTSKVQSRFKPVYDSLYLIIPIQCIALIFIDHQLQLLGLSILCYSLLLTYGMYFFNIKLYKNSYNQLANTISINL